MRKKDINVGTPFQKFFRNIFKRKNPDDILKLAEKNGLKKSLGIFDLIMLGVGAIIGSGIFTVVGIAAAGGPESVGAGPALIISMIVAAIACVFSALCYCEFAAMIPVAGSAYVYSYATMGEFIAWMVGWILILEYLIGALAVSVAWSGYFMQLIKGFSAILPDWIINPPIWLINDYKTACFKLTEQGLDPLTQIPLLFGHIPFAINLPAIFIVFVIASLLIKGTRESTTFATIMVFIKVLVILLFVAVGACYVKPENWTPFAPNGWDGIFMGAFIIFFAYIGFDALSTTAEECKNPKKDLPIAIIASLAICTIIYVLVAMVLTGMLPLDKIDLHAPIANAISLVGQNWIAGLISMGALAGLTSVILVMMLAGTRILYAMSRDNFLPRIFRKLSRKSRTPHVLTWFVAILIVIGTLTMNLNVAAELCNFGTFTSFIIVCIAVIILRKIDPNRERPFRVPFSPLFPALGVICCGGLMIYSMQSLTLSAVIFPIWVVLGISIYFLYGYRKNRAKEAKILNLKNKARMNQIQKENGGNE